MNLMHRILCAGDGWATFVRTELVPSVLDGVDLGDDVLEIGPGPGHTTVELLTRVPRLTVIEIDQKLANRLKERLQDEHVVEVVTGDATAMPFQDGRYSSVLCFTMLHHVPTNELQDQVFAEAWRVLRPGGLFTGSDSCSTSWSFRLLHLGDVCNVVDPDTLEYRLRTAGFRSIEVKRQPSERVEFRAIRE